MAYQSSIQQEPSTIDRVSRNREGAFTYNFTETLQNELSRNAPDYIRWVQQSLNQVLGQQLAVDGRLGPKTRDAIRNFQLRQGLSVDGLVGPQTERALRAAGAGSVPHTPSTLPPSTPFSAFSAFQPIPVENPGGGRVKDKTPPKPSDLITITGVRGKKIQLHRLAAQAWQALVQAARADGIREPTLLPTSGFRDPKLQEKLWREALALYGSPEEARKWVAPPGGSAHQTGRAIDFYLGSENSSSNTAMLRTLPAYRWLVVNAKRFGFYPYGREPWHWEYNPPSGGASIDVSPSSQPSVLSSAQLAQKVLRHPNISLWRYSPINSNGSDGADAFSNIRDTSSGRAARRSHYGNAPGGSVSLDQRMLDGMLKLANAYRIRVTAIAGGSHSSNSRHYAGIAFDIDEINGVHVNSSNPYYQELMNKCRSLGATEVLGPGASGHATHVHCAWSR